MKIAENIKIISLAFDMSTHFSVKKRSVTLVNEGSISYVHMIRR